MPDTIVIAGAGHAAGQAVATLKHRQYAGRIVLVGDEPHVPYQRPPLSKKYLAGALALERLHVKPASFYDDPNIELRLGTRIDRIDRRARTLTTADGDRIGYDRLILALGSRVRTLPVPGAELDGIHYLRDIADADGIRADMASGRSAVIVGAGYIGLEVAAVCAEHGLSVTVLDVADRVMSRVVSPEVSAFYERQHRKHGVDLRLSTGVEAFTGSGRVAAVRTTGGDVLPADFVVVGIGILPNAEIAERAGFDVDDGISVDDRCRTSDPNAYAIGDCTSHPNAIYGRRLRLESVHNALEQAKTAAANLCGDDVRYAQVPWFWSDQYDLKLQIAGLSAGYDEAVIRGDPGDAGFACCYLRDRRLVAVDAVNSPREFMQSKALIAARAKIDPIDLANPALALRDLG